MALGKILVGCDPELFLREKGTSTPVSANGLLPGTKKEPFKCEKGMYQIDGMAVELGIDPASTVEEWDNNIETVLEQVRAKLPPNLELTDIPTAVFDQAYFDAQPDAAKEMGCDPDYNAYTGQVNDRPKTDQPMRTAGGHVHGGFTEGRDITDPDLIADCYEVVKQLDFYLGLPSLEWDSDTQRRKLYGAAGACRIKPYGVEYRTLSSRWVLDRDLRRFVFEATVGAINDLYAGKLARQYYGENYAMEKINSGENVHQLAYWKQPNYIARLRGQPFFRGRADRHHIDRAFYAKAEEQQKFGQIRAMDHHEPFIDDPYKPFAAPQMADPFRNLRIARALLDGGDVVAGQRIERLG